jgi:hypothetical protein
MTWTTPADLGRKVRRRWDDGTLLCALAAGAPFPEQDLPVRGPRPGEIGANLEAVQRWIADLQAGSRAGRRYELIYAGIGGQAYGRNRVPARARLCTYEQAWSLLGVGAEVDAFQRVLSASDAVPAVRAWVATHPLVALEAAPEWDAVVAAYVWLDRARGSGQYLRQITAPGVDTKFVERHRPLLARLLGVERSATGFVGGLGLRRKPAMVSLRGAPGVLGLPRELSEGTFRATELAELPTAVGTAVIVENETTYLSVPVPEDGVVLWGKGFEVDRVGALPWLAKAEVFYWGDLDSHGFAILDRLRAWLPQSRSFLMDGQTLLAHRDRWVRDPSPTAARLTRLDGAEAALYADLVTDRFGESVRLEQERVDWAWMTLRVPYA